MCSSGCSKQRLLVGVSPTATTHDTLFVWLGRCTGGRREDVRTEEQTRRCPAANYASNTASRPTGPDHDKSPSASETRICTQPDNLLSWVPEHMGDKRKRVDAPTVRPLNVVSLRTTVAQVDCCLRMPTVPPFSLSWSTRLLGCSAPTN